MMFLSFNLQNSKTCIGKNNSWKLEDDVIVCELCFCSTSIDFDDFLPSKVNIQQQSCQGLASGKSLSGSDAFPSVV